MKLNLKFLIALCLVICLTLSVTGCKEKEDTSSTEVESVTEDSSQVQENETDDSLEETVDDPEDWNEDEYFDEEWVDELDDEFDESEPVEEFYVKNGTTPINNKFLGLNGVHMGFAFMPDKVANRTPIDKTLRETEYDSIAKTMGIKQIRSFYSSSIVWDFSKSRYEWDIKKNPYLSGFYDSLKAWQDRGVEVALSAHWSLAAFIGISHSEEGAGSFAGHGWYVENDLDTTLKNYSDFMRKSVLNLEANGIHNVKYWLAFTECNNTLVDATTGKRKHDEVCELYKKAVMALDNGLKASGRRSAYKIVGPLDNYRGDFDYTDPEQYSIMTEYTIKNLKGVVDIIGSHIYSRSNDYFDDQYYDNVSTTMGRTVEMAKNNGWEIWLDEFNVRNTSEENNTPEQSLELLKNPVKGVALGATVNGILNIGFNNSIVWSISDMLWSDSTSKNSEFLNGLQLFGYKPSPLVSMTPYYSWYSFSMLSRYIGQGSVYQTENAYGAYISCIKRTDGEWTIVVTNYNILDTPIHINFEKSMGGKTFYRHLYDVNNIIPTEEAKIIPVSAKASNVTTGFYDTLPGYSVAVYTTDSK